MTYGDLQSFNDAYSTGDIKRAATVLADSAIGKGGPLRAKFDQAIQNGDGIRFLNILAKAIYGNDLEKSNFKIFIQNGDNLAALSNLAGKQFSKEIDESNRRFTDAYRMLGPEGRVTLTELVKRENARYRK